MRPTPVLFAALVPSQPRAADAQTTDRDVAATVDRVTPALLEIRHQLHQNPELGNREVATAKLVAERLRHHAKGGSALRGE